MQKFLTRSLFLILLLSAAESWALPPCPGSYDNNTWTNCQRTSVGPYGYSEYVGEWKGGKRHGQGTHAWADGNKYVGEFKDDDLHGAYRRWKAGYQPRVCLLRVVGISRNHPIFN
jgi:hypothetical protein